MQKSSRFVRTAARPLVLGHRGARHAAPENTLRAFELARTEGADGVELDVRVDRDGNVIVLHDPDLARVTAGARLGHVEELPPDEVRRADVGQGERVPLLRDVLEWAEATEQCVNVEVKSDVRNRKALLSGVVRELEAMKRNELILLSSFDPRLVTALARRLPQFGVCWLFHEKQTILRRLPGWRALGAIGVNPEHTLLSSYAVRRFKAQGALVNTWTVNDPVLARAYGVFGVDSIISDCPGKILAEL
ncbi:MAG TPA: glycerophosphodiester phosphodiesterase family protein [Polyangiaceae bacterium]|nr:glycerophosphodiester phosphodiesterase family protein [Polyangiaceae bacterium]